MITDTMPHPSDTGKEILAGTMDAVAARMIYMACFGDRRLHCSRWGKIGVERGAQQW